MSVAGPLAPCISYSQCHLSREHTHIVGGSLLGGDLLHNPLHFSTVFQPTAAHTHYPRRFCKYVTIQLRQALPCSQSIHCSSALTSRPSIVFVIHPPTSHTASIILLFLLSSSTKCSIKVRWCLILKCEVRTREYGSSQTQQFHNSVP